MAVTHEQLAQVQSLYTGANYLGANHILRDYLGLDGDQILPLAPPHGVDFGQELPCMDLAAVEPVHWAHNERIWSIARRFKPAIRIPHPFLLAARKHQVSTGSGILIVGPPPGPLNDQRLHDLLVARGLTGATILVKPKRNSRLSERFWLDRGYQTASIASHGQPTYLDVLHTLARYEHVVGCTFSSVIIFSAALGKEVELLSGYQYRAYETADVATTFGFESESARDFVRIFISGSADEMVAASLDMLGHGLWREPSEVREELEQILHRLEYPLHFASRYPNPIRVLLGYLALRLNKPGIAGLSARDVVRRLGRRRVCLQEIDEIALWVEGRTLDNPKITLVPYVGGVTTPGDAVEQY
jgi:hypothetical protein